MIDIVKAQGYMEKNPLKFICILKPLFLPSSSFSPIYVTLYSKLWIWKLKSLKNNSEWQFQGKVEKKIGKAHLCFLPPLFLLTTVAAAIRSLVSSWAQYKIDGGSLYLGHRVSFRIMTKNDTVLLFLLPGKIQVSRCSILTYNQWTIGSLSLPYNDCHIQCKCWFLFLCFIKI